MKITRLRAQPAEHRAQVLEVARDQVLDAVDLLPAPAHRKQGGIEQHLAPALRDAWPDDHVDRAVLVLQRDEDRRSEEHTSELQSLMRISYAVFCLKKKKNKHIIPHYDRETQNK